MIGSAVMEPPPSLVAQTGWNAPTVWNVDRIRLPDMPHVRVNAPSKQGQCTVCYRMFGQIIIYDQNIFSFVHEILCKCRSCIWSDILQGCSSHLLLRKHDGIIHGTVSFQCIHQFCNGRCLLSDCNINTDNILTLLVEDGV